MDGTISQEQLDEFYVNRERTSSLTEKEKDKKMTPENFVYWVQGLAYSAFISGKTLNGTELETVMEKSREVIKEIEKNESV